jgi:Gnt-I system high-affinity gluconate transporter
LFLVNQLNADMALTLFYGIIISVPAILISGALYGSFFKGISTLPNLSFVAPQVPPEQLPPVHRCFLAVLLPIILISFSSIGAPYLPDRILLVDITKASASTELNSFTT